MYDILQLNDMLVPELKDIAEQLKVENSGKLSKQELIYKILDKQAIAPSSSNEIKEHNDDGKPRRQRRQKVASSDTPEETPETAVIEEKPIEPVVEMKM